MSVPETNDRESSLRVANLVEQELAYAEVLLRERLASVEEDRDIVLEMYRGALRAVVSVTADRDRFRRERDEARAELADLRERLLLGERVAA